MTENQVYVIAVFMLGVIVTKTIEFMLEPYKKFFQNSKFYSILGGALFGLVVCYINIKLPVNSTLLLLNLGLGFLVSLFLYYSNAYFFKKHLEVSADHIKFIMNHNDEIQFLKNEIEKIKKTIQK